MKRIARRVVLGVLGLLQHAKGDILVLQPASGSGFIISSSLDNYSLGTGNRAFDDFTIPINAAIDVVSWWGHQNTGANAFSITFYAGGALPGATLAAYAITPTITPDYFGTFYTTTLTTPFQVAAGTQYWLSIFNGASDASWGWLISEPLNTQGGLVQISTGSPYAVTYAPAFQLEDTTIPEPSSAALILSGLGICSLGARWHRHRQMRWAVTPSRFWSCTGC